MLNLLADVELSLCFGFLDIQDVVHCKQINRFCKNNINNYHNGWNSTSVNLEKHTAPYIVDLPFIYSLTINHQDASYKKGGFVFPVNCLFLKKE